MRFVTVCSNALLAATIVACGGQSAKSPSEQPIAAETKSDINAPEFLLVKVDQANTAVAAKSAATESQVKDGATAEQAFAAAQTVNSVQSDEESTQNSTESYIWRNGCYNQYYSCQPTYRQAQHRVTYTYYNSFAYNGCNYVYYRRNALAYWNGASYNNYNYYGYQNGYQGQYQQQQPTYQQQQPSYPQQQPTYQQQQPSYPQQQPTYPQQQPTYPQQQPQFPQGSGSQPQVPEREVPVAQPCRGSNCQAQQLPVGK